MGKIDKRDLTEVEERDLIESAGRGEWVSVGNIEGQRAFWKKVARQSLSNISFGREADMGKIDKRDLMETEERELIESSERGEWMPVGNVEAQRAFWKQAARQTLDGKRKRISISVPERDLVKLKTRAAEEGMPYQTLINSILHKYVEG